jgi:hypothetical protein
MAHQFFWAARTPKEEMVWYASFYLDGDAQQWYFRLVRNQGVPTWDRLVDLVSCRSPPSARSNPLGELIKIQSTGFVAEYQDQFLKLLTRCDGTAGLGDPLRIDVELQRPMTLEDAMGLSRAYECCIVSLDPVPASGRTSTWPTLRSSSAPAPVTPMPTPTAAPTSTPGVPQQPRPSPGTRFTRLTA